MLQLINGADNPILNVDDFYITEKWSGLDELAFTIPIHDPAYPSILEEALVQYEQPYLIKAIDAGAETAKVKCQIDLDDWKAGMLLDYTNGSNTAHATVSGVMPPGWHVNDHSGSVRRRTIEGEAYTPLEVVLACPDVYDVVVRFDVKNKILHLYDPDQFKPLGAFTSRELNLTEINYKGKSSEFATRLYAVGKDGMTFAGINGGKAYVEDHTYSDKIVSTYWKDERYTDPQSLLDDAKKTLKEMAVPTRSYSCSVVDLAATNPELYGFQDFSLFSVIRLIDDIKGVSLNHQVVEYKRYPLHPEKNVVTLSTVAPSISSTVKGIKAQIEKPTSGFRQQIQNLIDSMASAIAGYDGGNLIITQNAEGKPNGIMIMDTDDKATAKKVLWLNLMGITYSHSGADGPWGTVWSFEQGGFIADWLVAGVIQGIKIIAEQGVIAGWDINQRSMYKDVVASDGTIYRVYLQPPLVSSPNKTWILSCQKSTDGGKSFVGNFVLYSDGSARFGDTLIGADGTARFGENTYIFKNGTAKFGDTTIYANGNARFGKETGLNLYLFRDGLTVNNNGKILADLQAAGEKSFLHVNRVVAGKYIESSAWE